MCNLYRMDDKDWVWKGLSMKRAWSNARWAYGA